jgi:hypothetical protein
MTYATYFGGREDEEARELILMTDGSWLIGASTMSSNLPVSAGAVQTNYAGASPTSGDGGDCYLLRLSADGTRMLAATYFGGAKQERNVYGMALDRQDNIVITSTTGSSNLRTTAGSFQPAYGGGTSDMFAAKLSPDLRRVWWCTYLGGTDGETPRGGLALDAADNVVIVGNSSSTNYPTTPGAFQRDRRGPKDSSIVKLKADGSALVFGTLLGGTGEDESIVGVRLDAQGDLYVAGHTKSVDFPVTPGAAQTNWGGNWDAYLAKVSADGSAVVYATYLGGASNEFAEHRLWLEADGGVLLTGSCTSTNFPATSGAFQGVLQGPEDGFLVQWAPGGSNFVFATLLGGNGREFWIMPTRDLERNIYLVGRTTSTDLPVTSNAMQRTYGGGAGDGVLAIFSPDGTRLLYATYLGGTGDELVRGVWLGNAGEVYLVGRTSSPDFPITSNAVQRAYGGGDDAFIVKLERKGRLSARLVQSRFEVGLLGERGGRYLILTSTDLQHWSCWTNLSATEVPLWLADEAAAPASLKAFRAVAEW